MQTLWCEICPVLWKGYGEDEAMWVKYTQFPKDYPVA
jgi:hypothetical protein